MAANEHHPPDRGRVPGGFTLIELLIVIVILGVLATIVVFAVAGITDRGEASAASADERTLEVAQEAYYAEHRSYTDEEGLVAAGLLRSGSDLHDISLAGGTYTIIASNTMPSGGMPISFGGYSGLVFGDQFPEAVLIKGSSLTTAQWNAIVSSRDTATTPALFFATDPSLAGLSDPLDLDQALTDICSGNGVEPGIGGLCVPMIESSQPIGILMTALAGPPGLNWVDWDAVSLEDFLAGAGYPAP